MESSKKLHLTIKHKKCPIYAWKSLVYISRPCFVTVMFLSKKNFDFQYDLLHHNAAVTSKNSFPKFNFLKPLILWLRFFYCFAIINDSMTVELYIALSAPISYQIFQKLKIVNNQRYYHIEIVWKIKTKITFIALTHYCNAQSQFICRTNIARVSDAIAIPEIKCVVDHCHWC